MQNKPIRNSLPGCDREWEELNHHYQQINGSIEIQPTSWKKPNITPELRRHSVTLARERTRGRSSSVSDVHKGLTSWFSLNGKHEDERERKNSGGKKSHFLVKEHSFISLEDLVPKPGQLCSIPTSTLEHQDKYEKYYKTYFQNKGDDCSHPLNKMERILHTLFLFPLEQWIYIGETIKHESVIITVLKEVTKDQETGKLFHRGLMRLPKGDTRVDFEYVSERNSGTRGTSKKLQDFLKTSYSLPKLDRIKNNHNKLIPDLIQFEEKNVIEKAKIGVLYVREGQTNQDDMFGNRESSASFTEFLNLLGEEVVLKGFTKFRGGLDTKYDATGKTSYFTTYAGLEIMFHVSTLLPHFEYDKQQLEKKRHLGNDVVVIVFNESSLPFNHTLISSQFNQVYAVVTPVTIDGKELYKLEFSIKDGVPEFGPALPQVFLTEKSQEFRNLLLTKVLNGERAAYLSPPFLPKIKRTRQTYMEEIAAHYKK